jgi:glycosyltransferase involved in cell wall biosynthesis
VKKDKVNIYLLSNIQAVDHLGSGHVVKRFYAGLANLGHKVQIVEPHHYPFSSRNYKLAIRYRLMFGQFLYLARRWKKIKKSNIIVFFGGIASLSMLFIKLFGSYKGKIIHHTNGPENKYFDLGVKYGVTPKKWYTISESSLAYFSFSLPDLIITVSMDDKDWLISHSFPKEGKVLSISPGIEDRFIGLESDLSKKKKVIGFCGNWIPLKGIDLIIEVIPKILSANPEWEFWVLGARFPELVQSAFPATVRSRIKVFPFMEEKGDLLALYRQVAIQIMPSYYESFGLVMLESMACGCALITTRVGLGYELVSGEHALIMEEKTEEALYESLQLLIYDSELRERLSRGGHGFAQKFTWERAICELEGALHQLQES